MVAENPEREVPKGKPSPRDGGLGEGAPAPAGAGGAPYSEGIEEVIERTLSKLVGKVVDRGAIAFYVRKALDKLGYTCYYEEDPLPQVSRVDFYKAFKGIEVRGYTTYAEDRVYCGGYKTKIRLLMYNILLTDLREELDIVVLREYRVIVWI